MCRGNYYNGVTGIFTAEIKEGQQVGSKEKKACKKNKTRFQKLKPSNSVMYEYIVLNILQSDIVIVLQNTDSGSSKKLQLYYFKEGQGVTHFGIINMC